MEKKWSEIAWKAAEPVFQQIIDHPFIKELADGSLPYEKFEEYIRQDILYMKEYAKVMALMSERISDPVLSGIFKREAEDNILSEKALHERYLAGRPEEIPSPTCRKLISHLNKAASEYRIETAIAGVLPCFVVYEKTGRHILSECRPEDNPYMDWIMTYANEDFAKSTALLSGICDELASAEPDIISAMTHIFVEGTEMELKFWDAAWRMEK